MFMYFKRLCVRANWKQMKVTYWSGKSSGGDPPPVVPQCQACVATSADTFEYIKYSVSRTRRSIIQRTLNKLLISARQPAAAVSNRRTHRRRCTNGRRKVPSLPTNQRFSRLHFRLWAPEFGTVHSYGPLIQHRNLEWTQLFRPSCVGSDRSCCVRVRLIVFGGFILLYFIYAELVTSRRDVNSLLQTLRHPYAICMIAMRSPHLLSF